LGRVVKRRWEHVRLLYDLPNSTTLALRDLRVQFFQ
jgi:hypothetical protein